jgi:hypothetical protein
MHVISNEVCFCALQKQQNSLIAGLRATNELLTMQDHPEDKLKDSSIDRDSEGEPKVSFGS